MNRRLYPYALLALILASGTLPAQMWTQKASLPGPIRDAAIAFTIGDRIYLGGGINVKDFYEYNTVTGVWTRKADIPGVTGVRGFGAGFAIGQKGYVGLGNDGNTVLKQDLWEYDPASNTWARKADFPGTARDGITYFTVGSKGYVGGGSDNKVLFGDFYEYDPAADAWTQRADMPTGPVIFQAAFTIGDYGYVTTGSIGSSEVTETYRYNPAEDTWEPLADFPGTPRQTAVAFAVNGRGYVGLGQTNYTTALSDIYSYDPVKDKWSPVGTFPAGNGRCWSIATAANGKAYMGTGWDLANTFYNDWWEMNVSAAGVEHVPSAADGMRIYPNPARGSVEVTMPASERIGRITLIDPTGGEVITRELLPGSERATLDISALPSGAYLLRVQSGIRTWVEKIVKE